MGAFHDSPERRDAVIAALVLDRSRNATEELAALGIVKAPDQFAVESGLDPALVYLLRAAFVDPIPNVRGLRESLSSIKVGGNTKSIPHQWLIAVWWTMSPSLRSRVSDQALLHAGDNVVEMHRRILAGEKIAAKEWRTARRVELTTDIQSAATRTILASAWDLSEMPRAVGDVLATVAPLALAEAEHAIGWGALDEQTHRSAEAVYSAKLIEIQDLAAEQQKLARERIVEAHQAENRDLYARAEARNEKTWSLLRGWRDAMQGALTSLFRAMP